MKNIFKRYFKLKQNGFSYSKEFIDEFLNLNFDKKEFFTFEIAQKILTFKNKLQDCNLKILIHLPPFELSPAGFSIYTNLYENLVHLGIDCRFLQFSDDINLALKEFTPNVFLTSDDSDYIERICWDKIADYKLYNNLLVGLTASLEEYGSSPLEGRLNWAKYNHIDFYYSWRSQEYLQERKEYKLFYNYGFKIISIEFGANILKFHPVISNSIKQLDYIFFGSVNPQKKNRFKNYFTRITNNYKGAVYGPGWEWYKNDVAFSDQKYYYSASKVCLNLHLDEQILWPCELNERTYILGACNVPQLIDNPALLSSRYNIDNFYSADTPENYFDVFNYMLSNYDEVEYKTNKIFLETISKHTYFDRVEDFIRNISLLF